MQYQNKTNRSRNVLAVSFLILTNNSSLQALQVLIYLACSIYTIAYAVKRLYGSGMSPKVRSLFLKKQVYYVLTFIMMWACFLANSIV